MNSVHEPGSRTMSKKFDSGKYRVEPGQKQAECTECIAQGQPAHPGRAQRPGHVPAAQSALPRTLRARPRLLPRAPRASLPCPRACCRTPAASLRPLAQHARAPSALRARLQPAPASFLRAPRPPACAPTPAHASAPAAPRLPRAPA